MPSTCRLPFLVLFVGLVGTAGASAQTGANVLLVANESSPDSLRIAGHYARAGGGAEGIWQGIGDVDWLRMTIRGQFAGGVTFSPFAVKFQTDLGSFEFGDSGLCVTGDLDCLIPDQPIPEPASMVLFGTGLIAATALRRFRRKH